MTPSQQSPSQQSSLQQSSLQQSSSKKLQSTRGRSRASATAASAVFMLGASLMLSACGAQQPGAAAVVNGNTIRDQDVQRVALDLKPLAQDQKQFNPSKVLGVMIVAPYLLAEAKRAGHDITDAQARKVIAKVPNPSHQTVDFVRSQLAIQYLDQEATPNILAKLKKAKITLNRRYGTFDPQQASINPTVPNWIKPSASPAGQ